MMSVLFQRNFMPITPKLVAAAWSLDSSWPSYFVSSFACPASCSLEESAESTPKNKLCARHTAEQCLLQCIAEKIYKFYAKVVVSPSPYFTGTHATVAEKKINVIPSRTRFGDSLS